MVKTARKNKSGEENERRLSVFYEPQALGRGVRKLTVCVT